MVEVSKPCTSVRDSKANCQISVCLYNEYTKPARGMTMPNPFVFGGRITTPHQFIGRKLELQRIFGALETANTGQLQHISIVGPRRIGKSSLLYHITQIYPQRLQQPHKYRFVYIDLDDAHCHTLAGLLGFILQRLGLAHNKQPKLTQFQEIIEQLSQKQALHPVLCLDEFEHLTKRKEQFPDEVFEVWRSLGSNSKAAFVTASQSSLGELIQQGNLTSTFHNIFTHIPLGVFTDEDAHSLLTRNTDRPFTQNEQRQLFELTGKFPAKLQIAASLLYQAKEGMAIDWDVLQADYQRQVDNIFGITPAPARNMPGWLGKAGRAIFITAPQYLGRFVLDLFGRHDAKDSSASMLGWLLIGVSLAVLLGIFTPQAVVDFFKYNWRFFNPEK
jgi:uncharacterized protein